MATKISIKKSSVTGKVPLSGDLEVGELAINLTDRLLFSKDSGGDVFLLNGGGSSYNAGTGLTLTGNTFNIDNPFNPDGDYVNLRARSTTKDDVGLSGIPNTNGSTVNYLRGDGAWGTPPNTTYTAGTGLTLVGTEFQNTAPHIATNLGITGTGDSRTITSSTGTNVTIPIATTTTAGLMAFGDKSKLNGIETGAQVNVATNLGYTASTRVLTSSTGNNVTLPQVTTSADGLMIAADKSKLNGIANNATANTGTVTSVTGGDGLSGTITTSGSLAVDGTVVRTSRSISTSDGLTGGGTLASNRTLSVDSTVLRTTGSQSKNNTLDLTSSSYNQHLHITRSGHGGMEVTPSGSDMRFLLKSGSTSYRFYGNVTLDSGQFNGSGAGLTTLNASNLSSGTVADARLPSTVVRTSRTISTGNGLSGGGDLGSNRTFSLTNIAAGSTSVGAVYYNGTSRSAGRFYGGTTNPSHTTRLNYSGNFHANNFIEPSDIRLKSDIAPIQNAIDKVCRLGGYTYFKHGSDKRKTGVIAQEVLEVLPEAVSGSEDEHYSVAYGNIVGLLIEAIKEQQKEIQELKEKVNELTSN